MNSLRLTCLIGAALMTACSNDSNNSSNNGEVAAVINSSACSSPVSMTKLEATRLLKQATFGWNDTQLNDVMSKGFSCWLDNQLNHVSAYDSVSDNRKSHLERTIEIAKLATPPLYPNPVQDYVTGAAQIASDRYIEKHQMSAWLENALDASDQLRQRVAYALSQLEVVSTAEQPLGRHAEALAYYYDILARNALGSFRTLLQEMARSPAMGVYLSHRGNKKTDAAANIHPDENFAREIMQLFTIGLYMLNPDGTPQLDGVGNPIPTYSQVDIKENAKIMTGWEISGVSQYGRTINNNTPANYVTPMIFTADQHEMGSKTVLGHVINDDGNGGDLTAVIDMLFNHSNTAPFVSKHLITRLVTSNPSPAYVRRVATVFANNGSGVRGDLKAVTRAIMMDTEARGNSYLSPDFGKVDEPILAFTRFLKTFNVRPLDGWKRISDSLPVMNGVYWHRSIEDDLGQAPLRSSTVFNFYDPEFIPSDNYFATNKLVTPELQIQTPAKISSYYNLIAAVAEREKNAILEKNVSLAAYAAKQNHFRIIYLIDFDAELNVFEVALDGDSNGDFINISSVITDSNGDTPRQRAITALLAHLDNKMFAGEMLATYTAPLKIFLESLTFLDSEDGKRRARIIIKEAVQALASSSQYKIIK